MKIGRDAFLYYDPRDPKEQFAQCGTCRLFLPESERCAVIGPDTVVLATDSCGLYAWGTPTEDQLVKESVTAKEAGLVHRSVRCENCRFFDAGEGMCGLFQMLNEKFPDDFELQTGVYSQGCCNAQTPEDSDDTEEVLTPGFQVIRRYIVG
jgi:hypothetical protein